MDRVHSSGGHLLVTASDRYCQAIRKSVAVGRHFLLPLARCCSERWTGATAEGAGHDGDKGRTGATTGGGDDAVGDLGEN